MMGTRNPCLSSCSTMWGTAAAASSLLTVTRTSSDPARARAAHCWTVEGMSAVSVLVIDCTTTGASEPTRTRQSFRIHQNDFPTTNAVEDRVACPELSQCPTDHPEG